MRFNKISHRQGLGVLVAVLLWTATANATNQTRVVTVGANLTAKEQRQMIQTFGAPFQSARHLTINHRQVEDLLRGVAPESIIGTRSTSSSAVQRESSGYGIRVTTQNITGVTPAMYANALATAGVKNARIEAAAPSPVSGTAALAGILTAYQSASGRDIPYTQERTAAQELITSGGLGHAIGNKAAAATLIRRAKQSVLAQHATTPGAIRPIVVSEAHKLSINLTHREINQVTDLMVSISRLPIDVESLSTQLKGFEARAADAARAGFWHHVVAWLGKIWPASTSS